MQAASFKAPKPGTKKRQRQEEPSQEPLERSLKRERVPSLESTIGRGLLSIATRKSPKKVRFTDKDFPEGYYGKKFNTSLSLLFKALGDIHDVGTMRSISCPRQPDAFVQKFLPTILVEYGEKAFYHGVASGHLMKSWLKGAEALIEDSEMIVKMRNIRKTGARPWLTRPPSEFQENQPDK